MQVSIYNPEPKLKAIKAAMDMFREQYSKQTMDSPLFGYVSQLSCIYDAIENEMYMENIRREEVHGNP